MLQDYEYQLCVCQIHVVVDQILFHDRAGSHFIDLSAAGIAADSAVALEGSFGG